MRSTVLAMLTLFPLGLGGCDDTPDVPAPVVAATPAPQRPATGVPTSLPMSTPVANDGAPLLLNDPSAPADTPVCGVAAHEYAGVDAALLPRQVTASPCAAFACYDAATATYLGADGYRHVCR